MKCINDKERIVRCSVVGDSFVGKTALIKTFLRDDENTDECTSTVFDNFAGVVPLAEGDYTVSIFDTTGQHDFDGLRHFPYSQSNVVIVCYSVTDRTSFNNVSQFWVPEIKKYGKKGTTIILAATHCDINNANFADVRRNEGISLANNIGAFSLVETSMYDFANVSKLFEIVVIRAIKKRKNIISKLFRHFALGERTKCRFTLMGKVREQNGVSEV